MYVGWLMIFTEYCSILSPGLQQAGLGVGDTEGGGAVHIGHRGAGARLGPGQEVHPGGDGLLLAVVAATGNLHTFCFRV